jgi:4-aminobutyrate aminotransferase-like enzyme
MANGHPVAAVVARAEIMAEFRNAFGYFNTFGGNPVSCAAAAATLDVIEQENLVNHAKNVGAVFFA